MSYVYVMRGQNTGFIKVGRSKSPTLRTMNVKAEVGEAVELLAVFPCEDAKAVEASAHLALASDLCRRKEWFNITAERAVALVGELSGSSPVTAPPRDKIVQIRANDVLLGKLRDICRNEPDLPTCGVMLARLVERAFDAM